MTAKSSTFHGRDVFAPTGAHISLGRLRNLELAPTYVDLELKDPQVSGRSISGTVVYVDRFGNCVTSISGSLMVQRSGYGSRHLLNGSVEVEFVRTYGDMAHGRPMLTVGSFDLVEVSINQSNAAKTLGLNSGDTVTLDRL
jgi:S-adenosylmethionine hydrolase